jgi:hypothetical protein
MMLARAALRGRGRRVAGAGALLAALMMAATVRAESARRVVLVVPEAPGAVATEALARVRGELGAARFEVETDVVANNVDRRATVERALRKADARAAFGIFFGSGVAEIWVTDSVSGRTVVQTLPLSAAAPERRATVLAVKAVDLLKATLAEVWVTAPPVATPPSTPPAPPPAPHDEEPAASPKTPEPAASLPAPSPVEPPPPPPPQVEVIGGGRSAPAGIVAGPPSDHEEVPARALGRRLDLAVGAGWIGAGSISTWAPLLALAAYSGHVGARLIATGFGSSAELSQQSEGSVRLAYGLALAELAARQPFGSHFETTASVSAGAARLAVDGTGDTGYQGSSARVWSAVGGGGVGAAVLFSRLTVSVDARVLMSATSADVRIAGVDVVQAGRPIIWIGGALGVQL